MRDYRTEIGKLRIAEEKCRKALSKAGTADQRKTIMGTLRQVTLDRDALEKAHAWDVLVTAGKLTRMNTRDLLMASGANYPLLFQENTDWDEIREIDDEDYLKEEYEEKHQGGGN